MKRLAASAAVASILFGSSAASALCPLTSSTAGATPAGTYSAIVTTRNSLGELFDSCQFDVCRTERVIRASFTCTVTVKKASTGTALTIKFVSCTFIDRPDVDADFISPPFANGESGTFGQVTSGNCRFRFNFGGDEFFADFGKGFGLIAGGTPGSGANGAPSQVHAAILTRTDERLP